MYIIDSENHYQLGFIYRTFNVDKSANEVSIIYEDRKCRVDAEEDEDGGMAGSEGMGTG